MVTLESTPPPAPPPLPTVQLTEKLQWALRHHQRSPGRRTALEVVTALQLAIRATEGGRRG